MEIEITKNNDWKLFIHLLRPSWTSGAVALVGALMAVVGTILSIRYNGSSLSQDVHSAPDAIYSSSFGGRFLDISAAIQSDKILNNTQLFVVWCIFGILVYSLIQGVATAIKDIRRLETDMNYVHANKKAILRSAGLKFLLRSAIGGAWLMYIIFFFKVLAPYVHDLARIANDNLVSVGNIAALLFGIVIMLFGWHLHAIFLRGLVLKPRVFGSDLYL